MVNLGKGEMEKATPYLKSIRQLSWVGTNGNSTPLFLVGLKIFIKMRQTLFFSNFIFHFYCIVVSSVWDMTDCGKQFFLTICPQNDQQRKLPESNLYAAKGKAGEDLASNDSIGYSN